jgi:transposase-like protein
VLDILVQSRRSAKAAKRFFRKLLNGLQYVPRVIVTDKLRSYAAAKREITRRRTPTEPVSHGCVRQDFFDWRCYFLLARMIAWPRAGIRMQARHAA